MAARPLGAARILHSRPSSAVSTMLQIFSIMASLAHYLVPDARRGLVSPPAALAP